jgi:regulator of CtrA degradation
VAETAFFSRTFDDALALVVEARDYVADSLARDRDAVDTARQLVYDCETLRLTARLTQVMAWLLVQRAIHEGELSATQARAKANRLGGHSVCLADHPATLLQLPKRLQALMTRSLALYQRVARLDQMVAHGAA